MKIVKSSIFVEEQRICCPREVNSLYLFAGKTSDRSDGRQGGEIMSTGFGTFIVLWCIFFFIMLMIGGYFMFRKFLKSLPKEDGWSELDWQDYYIEQTRHLWKEETLQFLDELVQPVPELFRDVARRSIAAKIGELALKNKAKEIDQDLILKGYMQATPARDHKWLVKHLEEKNIDYTPYKEYLKINLSD